MAKRIARIYFNTFVDVELDDKDFENEDELRNYIQCNGLELAENQENEVFSNLIATDDFDLSEPFPTWKDGKLEEKVRGLKNSKMYIGIIEGKLEELGCEVKWGDSGIDDGGDGEDEYVMYESCDITDCDGETKWVTFYYGDNTREIWWINIH